MEKQDNSTNKNFFLNRNPSGIFENKSEEKVGEVNLIIDKIREKSPISVWDLAKELEISHSKLYYILRDLEFAGVIYSKVRLNKNNRSARMIYISNKKEVFENDG